MDELLVAAKNMIAQRILFFERNPQELNSAGTAVADADTEYVNAWNSLEAAVKKLTDDKEDTTPMAATA